MMYRDERYQLLNRREDGSREQESIKRDISKLEQELFEQTAARTTIVWRARLQVLVYSLATVGICAGLLGSAMWIRSRPLPTNHFEAQMRDLGTTCDLEITGQLGSECSAVLTCDGEILYAANGECGASSSGATFWGAGDPYFLVLPEGAAALAQNGEVRMLDVRPLAVNH